MTIACARWLSVRLTGGTGTEFSNWIVICSSRTVVNSKLCQFYLFAIWLFLHFFHFFFFFFFVVCFQLCRGARKFHVLMHFNSFATSPSLTIYLSFSLCLSLCYMPFIQQQWRSLIFNSTWFSLICLTFEIGMLQIDLPPKPEENKTNSQKVAFEGFPITQIRRFSPVTIFQLTITFTANNRFSE